MSVHRHYILTDPSGCVVDGWSDGPHRDRDTTGAVCINEHGGYQFRLDHSEENPQLMDEYGIPLWAWNGTQAVRRSAEEIEADRAALPAPESKPTTEERVTELEEALDLLLSGVTE